jgi:hypothetical protein
MESYKHTLRICNTYCFYTATIIAQKRTRVNGASTLPDLFLYAAKRKSVPINIGRRVVLTPFLPLQERNRNHESFMRKEVG